MQIVTIDSALISVGRKAFAASLNRETGAKIVPGAIMAAIEHGLTTSHRIIPAVARASGCRHSTIETVLKALAEGPSKTRMWSCGSDGHYRLATARTFNVMAF
jgi:hypothetical protein